MMHWFGTAQHSQTRLTHEHDPIGSQAGVATSSLADFLGVPLSTLRTAALPHFAANGALYQESRPVGPTRERLTAQSST